MPELDAGPVPNMIRRSAGKARLAFVLLLGIAGCTDLSVALRQVDGSVRLDGYAGFRFASSALDERRDISPHTRAMDEGLRAALIMALGERGYPQLDSESSAPLLIVDYTVRETVGVNEKRLDSPSDYLNSWRIGGIDDGSGSMDHTVADAAFNKELSVTVMLLPAESGRVAWEASARRSVPGDHAQGKWLNAVLVKMMRRTLADLPRKAR